MGFLFENNPTELPYFFGHKIFFFSIPKQSQRSRSTALDLWECLRRVKLHRIDVVICSHFRERKIWINTVELSDKVCSLIAE